MRNWLLLLLAAFSCFGADADAIFTAIRNNDLATVRALSREKVRNEKETTPLLYASGFGSVASVKILLDAGADANAANAFGATPLMWAISEPAKVRLLLTRGADVNAKSKTGRTALMLAGLHNGSDDVVELLLAKGASVKGADKDGMTFLLGASSARNPGQVKVALERGEDVNQKDSAGMTPLMNAASAGDVASVRLLLAQGADVNAVTTPDKFGVVKNGPIDLGNFTALMFAASYGPPKIVDLLLEAGAKTDPQDIRGMTALHYAVSTEVQHPEIVRLLLKAGADPAAKTKTGETAVDWAAKFSVPGVMKLLPATEARAAAPASGPIPDGLTARVAAARGMGSLEKVSGTFLNSGGCFACHAQNITALTANYAKGHGVAVNEKMQKEQAAGDKAFFAGSGERLMLRFDPPGGFDTLNYTLLHLSAAGEKSDAALDPLIHNVIAQQMADGGWHGGGFARAPIQDGDVARTALAVRAIRHFAWPARQADLESRAEAARVWLRSAAPAYNEDYTMQLLGLKWAGDTKEQLAPRAKKLAGLQREDGGWGQNANLPSDAYATGQTLVALSEAGMAASAPEYQRGIRFLLSTQHGDGTWLVKSRAPRLQPYFQSGFPYDHDQWISMAGTAWATMALAVGSDQEQVISGQ